MATRRPPMFAEAVAHRLGVGRLAAAVRERQAAPEIVREFIRRRPATLRETLESIIGDAKRPANVRTIAAVSLGEMRDSRSESVLLRAARSGEGSLARRAIEALGRIGSPRTLAQLVALRRVPEPAQRSLLFARSLIAYRHGMDGYRIALPRNARVTPIEPRRAKALPIERLGARAWASLRPQLGDAAAAVGTVLPPIELRCGHDRLLLFVHPSIDGGLAREALAVPRVAAVLLKWSPAVGRWFFSEYLLAHPQRGGSIELIGTRPSGEPVHRGIVTGDARRLVLEMAALDSPLAAPTRIDARLLHGQAQALEVDVRVEPDKSRQRNRPMLPRPVRA